MPLSNATVTKLQETFNVSEAGVQALVFTRALELLKRSPRPQQQWRMQAESDDALKKFSGQSLFSSATKHYPWLADTQTKVALLNAAETTLHEFSDNKDALATLDAAVYDEAVRNIGGIGKEKYFGLSADSFFQLPELCKSAQEAFPEMSDAIKQFNANIAKLKEPDLKETNKNQWLFLCHQQRLILQYIATQARLWSADKKANRAAILKMLFGDVNEGEKAFTQLKDNMGLFGDSVGRFSSPLTHLEIEIAEEKVRILDSSGEPLKDGNNNELDFAGLTNAMLEAAILRFKKPLIVFRDKSGKVERIRFTRSEVFLLEFYPAGVQEYAENRRAFVQLLHKIYSENRDSAKPVSVEVTAPAA